MSMQWRAFCSSAALLAGLCVASQSFAADLDMISYEPGAPVQQPVEVGSGWYLRGDIGYNLSSKVKVQTETSFWSASQSYDLDKNVVPSVGVGRVYNAYSCFVPGKFQFLDLISYVFRIA